MRQASVKILDRVATTGNGSAQNVAQVVSASFQVYCSTSDASGTLKLQASNDVAVAGDLAPFTPTNWTDIPNATVTVTSGSGGLITIGQMCYVWVRAVYTQGSAGAAHVICQMNVLSI